MLCPSVDRPIKIIGPAIKASKEEALLGSTIKASKEKVLLGVRIDNDLTFKENITSICSQAIETFNQETYRDFQPCFSALLEKDESFTIHQKNLQLLAIEIFKERTNISSDIMNEIFYFSKNSASELRRSICLSRSNIHSAHFGI